MSLLLSLGKSECSAPPFAHHSPGTLDASQLWQGFSQPGPLPRQSPLPRSWKVLCSFRIPYRPWILVQFSPEIPPWALCLSWAFLRSRPQDKVSNTSRLLRSLENTRESGRERKVGNGECVFQPAASRGKEVPSWEMYASTPIGPVTGGINYRALSASAHAKSPQATRGRCLQTCLREQLG